MCCVTFIFQGVALDPHAEVSTRFYLMIEYCGNDSLHKYLQANQDSFREELQRSRYYDSDALSRNRRRRVSSGSAARRHDYRMLVAWSHQVIEPMNQ